MKSVWMGQALIAFALLFALSGCDKVRGVAAVQELCAKDGGERIFRTKHESGYLATEQRYFCRECIEALGEHEFEYVDAHVLEAGKRNGQYFRYTLGHRGDNKCEDLKSEPIADTDRLLRQLGIKENECVVATQLPNRPAGSVLSQQWHTLSIDGVTVRLNEWKVIDERSDTLLAQVKDYQFTSKLTSLLDMSGHGGNADEKCMKGNSYVNSVTTLASRVLRDEPEHQQQYNESGRSK